MYSRVEDFSWDFKTADTKEYTHCYHNYPAVMIPQIARKLLNDFRPEGKFDLVFDPYMGSGTTLVEAILLGLNAIGTDVNPLARLISEVKTNEYELDKIKHDLKKIENELLNYKEELINTFDLEHITNPYFWYSENVLKKLVYIENEIYNIDYKENINFFKVALSESIREASYTRNGEFKRYRISQDKIESFNIDPFLLFVKKMKRNKKGLEEFNKVENKGIAEISNFNTVNKIPDSINDESIDMIVTSPPYGDSKTTVAYGQFSRWTNEWFKFENAKDLDSKLMGGKKVKKINFKTESIVNELNTIQEIDEKRYFEVCYFLEDYYNSIKNISKKVRIGGRVCYVVGNRNVKGIQIPLDYFTAEMFEKFGFKHETTIVRNIPNKRMPSKTSPTNIAGAKVGTMSNEYIVILTKK